MGIFAKIIGTLVGLVHAVDAKIEDIHDKIEDKIEAAERKFDVPAGVIAERLDALAAGTRLKWRTSIVDLLKLLKIDSSLKARRELAADLGHEGTFDGTAEENARLHKELLAALAAREIHLPQD